MQCPRCRRILPPTARFCGYCGELLQAASTPPTPFPPSPPPSTPPLPSRQAGWGTWLGWTLISTTCWIIGPMAGLVVGGLAGAAVNEAIREIASLTILAAMLGTTLGIGQWLVLHRRLHAVGWWIPVSTITITVGTTISIALAEAGIWIETNSAWSLWITLGAALGIGQWLILRRRLRSAGWWIPATMVSMAVTWVGLSAGQWYAFSAYGALTGAVMVWLLRHK